MYSQTDFYTDILDNLHEGVYFVDPARRILYWSKGAERISGLCSAAVVGRPCSDNILMHIDEQGALLCQTACPLAAAIALGQTSEAETYLRHASGQRVPVRVRAVPMRGPDGSIIGAIEIFSERAAAVNGQPPAVNPNTDVLIDPLTTLGNRQYLEAQIRSALSLSASDKDACAILLVDIDDLEPVNHAYGRIVGDRVLAMVGAILRQGVRGSDVAGRWNGDQFGVVLRCVTYEQLLAIANKLRLLVEHASLTERQHPVRVTVSIGAALSRPSDTLDTLVARAGNLLRQSQSAGGNHLTCAA